MGSLASPAAVKRVIDKFGFRFKKSLGQNFIIDHNIIANIVKTASLSKEDLVVEIGPGIGSLTEELTAEAGQVIAVEIDKQLIEVLKDTLQGKSNLEIINSDILKLDLDELAAGYGVWGKKGKAYKVVANLPYYITTPVIMHLLENNFNISEIVIMIQKEVADRIAAQPGTKDYGALSLALQYYTEAEIVLKVPRTVFMPRPEVDSSVLRLKRRVRPPVEVEKEEVFFRTIKAAFSQRRKTLLNALSSGLGLDKKLLTGVMADAGIDFERRGETLTLVEFAKLSNQISKVL